MNPTKQGLKQKQTPANVAKRTVLAHESNKTRIETIHKTIQGITFNGS